MAETRSITLLCLTSFFKGTAFLEEAHRLGCRVLLLTREKLKEREWPWESIDEVYYMPDLFNVQDVINAVSYLARSQKIDRIVALDDYDVMTAASLREHLRIPGIGETTIRYFRDKLAMRHQAREYGIPVPDFVGVINYDEIRSFMKQVPPPWVLKPRTEAGAIGIKKVSSEEEFWRLVERLGDRQSYYLLEKFLPGDVYHVDSIIWERTVQFALPSGYARPPMNVAHEGGIFITRTLKPKSPEFKALIQLNEKVLEALGMVRGVTHLEYIRSREDGRFYFLEAAARVGGANIVELVEAASGLNLWREWARIEVANARGEAYQLPQAVQRHAGLILCLARQEWPDTSAYTDPEIVWRMKKRYHAGLIVASDNYDRVSELLADYEQRFARDFLAVQPPVESVDQMDE
ncbi:MAG: ATPase [Calditrichaeota bacterium]|nr:MAG: ATPase [Calditrichota bacterium]